MSLLEDVFLQDEGNEAEELERVIDGDEFEERRRSDSDDNSGKEDEAEEEKRRVDPTKAKPAKVVKNPRFLLNPARLTGPRGIQVIPEHFKDFKFKGKGHEKEDLDLVLKKLEHWAYRLYPKFQFEDCLKKIETLGKKRPVAVHLHKIRSDQFLSEDTVVQKDSSDEDTPMPAQEDEFDKLLQQQIDLARSTPAPSSAKKPEYNGSMSPKDKRMTSIIMPKATSSPSISDEQRERMLNSRKLAEERRLARLKNAVNTTNIPQTSSQLVGTDADPKVQNSEINTEQNNGVRNDTDKIEVIRKHNRSNVIDSSDDETEAETRVSIAVDVHNVNVAKNNNIPEKVKKSHVNDLDHSSDTEEIIDVANEADKNITNDKSNTDVDNTETTEKIVEENIVKTNSLHENNETYSDLVEQPLYSEMTKPMENNTVDNSGENEELRYDDSDMNIGVDENNMSDHIAKENVLSEKAPNINNADINDLGQIEVTTDSVEKERSKENCLSENVLDDVMDVDFSDDF